MKKIFFAFLDELAHSKQFLKSRENDLHWTPAPPLLGKIPENSGLFSWDAFPYGVKGRVRSWRVVASQDLFLESGS